MTMTNSLLKTICRVLILTMLALQAPLAWSSVDMSTLAANKQAEVMNNCHKQTEAVEQDSLSVMSCCEQSQHNCLDCNDCTSMTTINFSSSTKYHFIVKASHLFLPVQHTSPDGAVSNSLYRPPRHFS